MPLADVRVRQALSLAIDRQEIIDNMLYGFGLIPLLHRVHPSNSDITPYLRNKWQAWADENQRYDPEEARRLIAEAGYPDGFDFDIWSAPDSSAPYLADLVLVVAGYWEDVGAHANVIPVDGAAWKANRHTSKSLEMVGKIGSAASSVPRSPTATTTTYFHSTRGSCALLDGSPDQARFDELTDIALASTSLDDLEPVLDEMFEIMAASWAGLTIVQGPVTYAIGPRVHPDAPTEQYPVYFFPDWEYTGIGS
jgi:ABC-type transport system substrate-binding protein